MQNRSVSCLSSDGMRGLWKHLSRMISVKLITSKLAIDQLHRAISR